MRFSFRDPRAYVAAAGALLSGVLGYGLLFDEPRTIAAARTEAAAYTSADPATEDFIARFSREPTLFESVMKDRLRVIEALDIVTDGAADKRLGPCTPAAFAKLEGLPSVNEHALFDAKEIAALARYEHAEGAENCAALADDVGVSAAGRLGFFRYVDRFQHGTETGTVDYFKVGETQRETIRALWQPGK